MAHTTATRRTLDYVVALLLLSVPAAFLHASFKNPQNLNFFDRAVLTVSAPLQSAAAWVIEGIGGVWNRYVALVDVEEENDELRVENERLRAELAEARRRAAEVAGLERLVDLRRRVPAETVGARVLASGMNPYFRVTRITLDRGDGDLREGNPVISTEGLVGRVLRAYGDYADVLLATDPQSAIDVVVPRTGSRGVLKGVGDQQSYTCRIDYMLKTEPVKEGDLVVTSGLGGVFPKDIPVGRIRSVTRVGYGLYQEVEVEPVVDFSHLSRVLVILSPAPPPDPENRPPRATEDAFGVGPR